MSPKNIILFIILAVCAYFFYTNFDFETKTLKTSDKLREVESAPTQQTELHEVAKNL